MRKLFILFVIIQVATSLMAQNNVITYTASEKLPKTNKPCWELGNGLHIKAFGKDAIHEFSDGKGVIRNVRKIDEAAFKGCSSLTSITIPEGVSA